MTARWSVLVVMAMAIAVGCASGSSGGGPGDGPPGSGDGPRADAPRTDGPPPGDGPPPSDGPGTSDGPIGGTGLDPELELPDPSGQFCDEPGRGSPECPLTQVCRFFTSTEGRCESCAACGNLGAACTATDQCDILFECFRGRCTNFCTLGTTACGPPADCINIGHATRGVCKP